MAGRTPTKTYKIERTVSDTFDAMAAKSYFTGPMAITMLMDAALIYAEEYDGKFPAPIRIVNELEYEQFQNWKITGGSYGQQVFDEIENKISQMVAGAASRKGKLEKKHWEPNVDLIRQLAEKAFQEWKDEELPPSIKPDEPFEALDNSEQPKNEESA